MWGFFWLVLWRKIFFVFLDVQWKFCKDEEIEKNWSSLKDFQKKEKKSCEKLRKCSAIMTWIIDRIRYVEKALLKNVCRSVHWPFKSAVVFEFAMENSSLNRILSFLHFSSSFFLINQNQIHPIISRLLFESISTVPTLNFIHSDQDNRKNIIARKSDIYKADKIMSYETIRNFPPQTFFD